MTAVMVETCRRGHEWTAETTYWRSDGYRQCRTCKQAAKAAHYAANREKARAQGRARSAAWRAANPEKDRARKAERRDRLRAETLAAYGGCCAQCGKTGQFGPPNDPDALQLDHINGDGAAERERLGGRDRGGWLFFAWLRKQGFPGKGSRYQLLCSGCHREKTAREAGNATT